MVNPADYVSGRRDRLLSSARKYGTPQYFLDEDVLRDGCLSLVKSFSSCGVRSRFFYPYKTNGIPRLLSIIHGHGIGAETSSLLEMELAKKMGVRDIVFNGPGKTREEIAYALRHATTIIDSPGEARRVCEEAAAAGLRPRLGVRLSIGSTSAEWRRFGVAPDELAGVQDELGRCGLRLEGIHFHVGTGLRSPKPFVAAIRQVGTLIGSGAVDGGQLRFVDVGGGIGSCGSSGKGIADYAGGWVEKHTGHVIRGGPRSFNAAQDIGEFSRVICDAFRREVLPHAPAAELWAEPGRWLAAPCVHALMSVLEVKRSGAILDGGMNLVPNALHEHYPAFNLTRGGNERVRVNLWGPLSMSNDKVSATLVGGRPSVGDVVCLLNVGAYNPSWTRQFIKPLPRVVSSSVGGTEEVVAEEDLDYRVGRSRGI
jgi:diaminopimelate decarboxylase